MATERHVRLVTKCTDVLAAAALTAVAPAERMGKVLGRLLTLEYFT